MTWGGDEVPPVPGCWMNLSHVLSSLFVFSHPPVHSPVSSRSTWEGGMEYNKHRRLRRESRRQGVERRGSVLLIWELQGCHFKAQRNIPAQSEVSKSTGDAKHHPSLMLTPCLCRAPIPCFYDIFITSSNNFICKQCRSFLF